MKFPRLALLASLALAALAPVAQGQLISRTGLTVTGASTGVKTTLDLWINLTTNTFTVDITNNVLGSAPGYKVGTVVGFAFNTPQFNNFSTSSVAFSAKWITGSAPNLANGVSSNNYWSEYAPYDPSGANYDQDYGVYTSNYAKGVEYGEKTSLVFQFGSNDLTLANLAGFFDNAYSASNTSNRDYDITVQWADVSTLSQYVNDCYRGGVCDIGGLDLLPPSGGDLPVTPEPSTYGLVGAAALMGLIARRRNQAKKAASK